MTYFTYNGRSSAEFGLHIEKKMCSPHGVRCGVHLHSRQEWRHHQSQPPIFPTSK